MVRALVGLVAVATLAAPAPARADILVLYTDLQAGGMYGTGTGGEPAVKDQAFFANVPNLTYGFALSARFLLFGATLQHHQYAGPGGDGLGTWTQLMAGLDFAVDVGGNGTKNKPVKPHTSPFVHLAVKAGFGVGTGQQVDPPLSNDQIDDKAVLASAAFAVGKHLNKLFDLGVAVPVTYGYFLKNGVPANDLSNHYQGVHVEALVFLRLRLKVL